MSMSWLFRRQKEAPPLTAAGLLGKIPSTPDFVRVACSGELPDALDRWLVEASPRLHETVGVEKLPVSWFCHASPRADRALIGVLGPSRDSAGRGFPVALFRELTLSRSRADFAALIDVHRRFLEAVQALYADLPGLSSAEIRERLGDLPDPENERAGAPLMAAGGLPHLFESDLPGTAYYALGTFTSAFQEADAESELALACPIRDEQDAKFWLGLAARLYPRNQGGPSFLLSHDPPRLLISVAAPGPELLCALAEPEYIGAQIWPLTTQNRPAIEHARAALTPILPRLDAADSLDQLADRLAAAGAALLE